MALSTALNTELEKDVATTFWAVECLHPFGTFRLIDTPGIITIGGQVYTGYSDTIGSLGAVDVDEEGAGDEAPTATFTINPINAATGVSLCTSNAQGAGVIIRWGAVNPSTGVIIDYQGEYRGSIDVPTLNENGSVTFECDSAFASFFEANQGQRISQAFLETISSGDKAFQYVVDVANPVPIGRPGARPSLSTPTVINTNVFRTTGPRSGV